MKQVASDGVRLEVRPRLLHTWDSARQEVEVARAAIAQAQDSLRIGQNRLTDGGGSPRITDLLSTEEATRRSQTDHWEALFMRFHT